MTLKNRVRTAASIDSSGGIVIGTALGGFTDQPVAWDGYPGPGHAIPYLLENGTNWEAGYLEVDQNGALTSGTNGSLRHVVDTDHPDGCFPNGTTGLTFSQVPLADCAIDRNGYEWASASVWAAGAVPIDRRYAYRGVGFGPNTEVLGTEAVAFGSYARAQGNKSVAYGSESYAVRHGSVALGHSAQTFFPYEVVMGQGGDFGTKRQVPIRATGVVSGTPKMFEAGFPPNEWFFEPRILWGLKGSGMGPVRVRGTVVTMQQLFTGSAHAKVFNVDYTVWIDNSSGAVLGTPTFTTIFSGGSTINSTLSLDAQGILQVSHAAGGSTLVGYGMMTIETLVPGSMGYGGV